MEVSLEEFKLRENNSWSGIVDITLVSKSLKALLILKLLAYFINAYLFSGTKRIASSTNHIFVLTSHAHIMAMKSDELVPAP